MTILRQIRITINFYIYGYNSLTKTTNIPKCTYILTITIIKINNNYIDVFNLMKDNKKNPEEKKNINIFCLTRFVGL